MGFVSNTLKMVQNSQNLSKEQISFLETLFVLYDVLKIWDFNLSNDFMKKMFLCINQNYKEESELFDYKLLNKKFKVYFN